MAIIDVVKCEINRSEVCHKFPSQDLRYGTQLVVYEMQTAFFVKGGKILDEISEPGTYTLKSDNIPILGKLINLPFGGNSPFQAEVWFVNRNTTLDIKWGTPVPIQLEDPKYGIIVPVRAFGQYGIKISSARTFLETILGNMHSFTTDSINSYFKGKLLSNLNSILAQCIIDQQISILDINAHLMDISMSCQTQIHKYFEKYGISLEDFSIISINVPQEDPSFLQLKEAKSTMAQLNITGRDIYQMKRSFDVLETAAHDQSNGSQFMGLGIGVGLGGIMGSLSQQTINTSPQMTPPPIFQEKTYFVYINGEQVGGQTISMISSMIRSGRINGSTLVWTSGMDSWKQIQDIPEMSELLVNNLTPPTIPDK